MSAQQLTLMVPLTPNADDDNIKTTQHRHIRATARLNYHKSAIAELERALVILFGGYTAVDGRGAWEEGSVVLRENVRVYTIAADKGMTAVGMTTLRERVKDLLDQRAVYLAAYDLAEKPVQ